MEIEEKSRALFMKYALPCAGTLVKRGNTTQENVGMLIDAVKNGKKIPKDAEKIFKVAFAACSLIAIDEKKKKIDSAVIRKYFIEEHDDMIGKRYAEMGDFDPDLCRTRIGKVESLGKGFAFVKTLDIKKRYRTDYCDVKKGDKVVTHWNFVVEKTGKNMVFA